MSTETSSQLTEHLPTGLAAVEEAIARACKEARRDRASVTLVAVSKTFDADAIELFDAIHSVDRPSLCEALAKEFRIQTRRPQLFVQLNTGEEPQKAGIAPADADNFIANCRDKYSLPISGLMCIPPVDDAPAPHFALTAKIAARNGLKNLSMGMSADFAIAIAMGATHVRVGSAIFGHRTSVAT